LAIVFAEVGNRLVIGSEPAQQPHQLDIAAGFSFKPSARLHPVQVAVDVQLQENRRMIRRPTSRRWINSIEAHLGQIKRIDKHVDHTNGVALADEIIEAFGQQGRLPAIWPRNEALHPIPPTESRENHSGGRVFTQPGSFASYTSHGG